ncbi:MAG: hypothetical protein WCS34_06915 [Bacteroidales bacterium]
MKKILLLTAIFLLAGTTINAYNLKWTNDWSEVLMQSNSISKTRAFSLDRNDGYVQLNQFNNGDLSIKVDLDKNYVFKYNVVSKKFESMNKDMNSMIQIDDTANNPSEALNYSMECISKYKKALKRNKK